MIGASAAISGTMAAAMRFAFQRGGPLGFRRSGDDSAYRVPAIPLIVVLRDPRVLAFLVVWFGINMLFGARLAVVPASATARSWPGRRISAAFSPACCCFPGSIRRRSNRTPTILVQRRNKPTCNVAVKQCGRGMPAALPNAVDGTGSHGRIVDRPRTREAGCQSAGPEPREAAMNVKAILAAKGRRHHHHRADRESGGGGASLLPSAASARW